jgi:hypothetical protein
VENTILAARNLRREHRFDARIPTVIVRGRDAVPAFTSDVSYRGIFLQTAEPPPLRALLRLRLQLPTREIQAHAMAVHVNDGTGGRARGVGLLFWGLAGPERKAWDAFVRELSSAARPPGRAANTFASAPGAAAGATR